ncbi:MAG: DEAD/DEAH box helicase [Lentilactobacillus diolivorans]|jgi:SNF2 family DNA or RNA helicase|nr:DEAD/DEAH box helicase [Lentilactobacillus diolivorans]
MDLGKTFIGSERLWENNTPYNLVICQKSKVNDWYQHFKQYYADDYQVIKYESQTTFPVNSVLIVNYEKAWRRPQLKRLHDFTLMLDESSKIKNDKSKQTKFILGLRPDNVILLSGTPTGGKYEELWSQCKLLGWNIGKTAFLRRYTIQKWNPIFSCYEIKGYQNTDELIAKLHQYGAVFKKTEEVLSLPTQNHITIKCDNTTDYRKFKADHYLVRKGEELIGDRPITAKLIMRKLAGVWNPNKLAALNELIESTNDRLIIFYNFNLEFEALKKLARKHKRPISVVNGAKRNLKAYDDKSNSITLIQYQAGALGLNLQKASKIVYFTLTDKSELFEQSKKRIHRIGQDKPCFYYYLLTKNSIEPQMLATLKMRKDYTDKLFEKKNM